MSRPLGVALLLVVTLIWGTTFVVIKGALESVPVPLFLALRFTAAALLLSWVRFDRKMLLPALALGVVSFASYGSQTLGLSYTTASKGAFITALCVIIVPFMSGLLFRVKVAGKVYVTAGIALAGLALLTLGGQDSLNRGDLIILGTAVAYALHIILMSQVLKSHPPLKVAALQLWPVALISWIWAAPQASLLPQLGAGAWWSIIYLAVVATALVLVLQSYAQRVVPAHVAALVFVLEPVFAAFFAYWFTGEQLGAAGLIGGGMVFAALLLSELKFPQRGAAPGLDGQDSPEGKLT
jgi:drug/metabolite transporter (DMT)-like permease